MPGTPVRIENAMWDEIRAVLETRRDDIRRIAAGTNAIDEMFAQFAELVPNALRETARQVAPVMTQLFREDYFRLDGGNVGRGGARLPFPEDQSWIPSHVSRWQEGNQYRIQLPSTGKDVLCQGFLTFLEIVVFGLFLVVVVVAAILVPGPGAALVVLGAVIVGMLAIGILEFLRMYCDVSPVMLEWRRGEEPRLFQDSSGGWAS